MYEGELKDRLIRGLKRVTGAFSDAEAYQIAYLRYVIRYGRKGWSDNLYLRSKHLCEVAGLRVPLSIEGERYDFHEGPNKLGITDLVEEWEFDLNRIEGHDLVAVFSEMDKFARKTVVKLFKYGSYTTEEKQRNFKLFWQYGCLKWLLLNRPVLELCSQEQVIYDVVHKIFQETVLFVSEQELEEYLIRNLHLIEEGLTPVKQQERVGRGRIDIWARDLTGQDVIIELKVEKDKDIFWQVGYYPNVFEKKYGKRPRMLVVSNSWEAEMQKDLLNKYPETECFELQIKNAVVEVKSLCLINS